MGLKSCSPTRWSGAYISLHRLVELKNIIIEEFGNVLDYEKIEKFTIILKPLYDFQTKLETDKEPSVHLVIPSILQIYEKLEKLESAYSPEVKFLFNEVIERFGNIMDERRDDFQQIYAISTFLHPLMECCLDDCLNINIKKQLKKYLNENETCSSSSESINLHDSVSEDY
ncbi:hypothetical protein SNEBB_006959, partial [Seison nebaliae]